MINASTLLAGLSCLGLCLPACTTTYRESGFSDERLEEPNEEAPNCSILADEPGCAAESPFDPEDEEEF